SRRARSEAQRRAGNPSAGERSGTCARKAFPPPRRREPFQSDRRALHEDARDVERQRAHRYAHPDRRQQLTRAQRASIVILVHRALARIALCRHAISDARRRARVSSRAIFGSMKDRRTLLAMVGLALLAGCGGSGTPTRDELIDSRDNYDPRSLDPAVS